MSAELTCRFEELDRGILAVTLRPELNEVPWTDIEQIGSGIVERITGRNRPRVVVDLSELNHMGSAMVALVVRVWKAVTEKKGRMVVVHQNDFVGEVLEVSGLAGKWTIVSNRDEAIDELGGRGGESYTGTTGETRSGIVLTIASAVLLLLAVLGLGDAVAEGVVANSLGRATIFWIGIGCAILAAILGVVAVIRTFGNLKIVAVVLTTLSVVTGIAGAVFVS